MVKLENISNNLMSNPLVCVVIALFVLLIILGIIRLLNPGFSVGAQVKGHFGSLNGQFNIEGFEDDGSGNIDHMEDGSGTEDGSETSPEDGSNYPPGSEDDNMDGNMDGNMDNFMNQY